MLTLVVDAQRWRRHLSSVLDADPALVPVVKGNGYGLGVGRLAGVCAELGVDTVAVGTYAEVGEVEGSFPGSVLVLTAWRPSESRASFDPRLVHTLSRVPDANSLAAAAGEGHRPRVVLELLTSMLRHGFTPRALREVAGHLEGVDVEGFALHLPMSHGSHVGEVVRRMDDVVASGIASRTVFVSHLRPAEMTSLRASYPDFTFRPRVGTGLWLGDRGALTMRTTVLDVHPVERGDVFGYRGRSAPKAGSIVVVSGGTAHGIGLEAPTGGASLRDRAARVARGGLDAAGFVRSPFRVGGKARLFAEPPHMQASMLFLPAGADVPEIGDEVTLQVRFTTTTPDRTVFV